MLLQKAKVVTTPTAYSDGFLHSVKPNNAENLLLQSNQFDTTWSLFDGTLTSGQSGYDGTNDAWLLDASATLCNVQQGISESGINTFSVYAKAGTQEGLFIRLDGGSNPRSFFNLSDGTIGSQSGSISNIFIQDVGNGWYRCGISTDESITRAKIYVATPTTFPTSGSIYIQDAQLNKGYSADQYIETTTETSPRADFTFTRNSSATRVGEDGYIQDVQIIGGELVQNGDFEEIGSELVTNGTFDTDSDWVKGTGWSIANGKASCDGSQTANSDLRTAANLALGFGKLFRITFEVKDYVSGEINVVTLLNTGGAEAINISGNGIYTAYSFAPSGGDGFLKFEADADFIGSIDNVSVKEVGQDWTFNTSGNNQWSIAEGQKASYAATATDFIITSNILTIGRKYRVSFDILGTGGSTIRLSVNSMAGGSFEDYTLGDGRYTEDLIAGTNYIRIGGASSGATFSIDNISVKEVTDDTNLPRINYEGFTYENGLPIYGSGKGHLLLEGQRTNLVGYSEDYSSFDLNFSTLTSNAAISPDGTQNASLIESTTTASCFIANQSASITIGNTYTFSVFAKKGNNDWIRMAHISSAATAAWFDLENGVVGTVNSISATIEDYGNGWYRCTNTFVATNNSGYLTFIGICDGDNSTNAGAIGQNDYIWGWQLEEASYASSYIPTLSGTAVTRLGETCNNATHSFPSEGVLYAEIAALANDGTYRSIAITDGTSSNRVMLYYTNTDNQIVALYTYSGVSQAVLSKIISNSIEYNKAAIRYKENDVSFWVNGVLIATDTTATAFPSGTLSELKFDSGVGGSIFYGKTKMVATFPYLSNDEMECLTGEGYGSFEAMALANNYTIIE